MNRSSHLLLAVVLLLALGTASAALDWRRVVPAEPAIFLEVNPTDPGVQDPATAAAFRNAPVATGAVDDGQANAWKDKPKFVPAYKVQHVGVLGLQKARIDRKSQQAIDPKTVHRECPRADCPAFAKCADPTMTCCKTGNFSFCCPTGTTCLTTDTPTCIKESLDDPEACTEQTCLKDHHCPLSKVSSCCFGGTTCCPYTGKCTADDPPKCRVLSRFELLNKRQPEPVGVVKSPQNQLHNGKLVANDVPFAQEPFPVVPIGGHAKKAAPKPQQQAAPKNITVPPAPLAPSTPVKPKHISLFPDKPTAPGERSRQRSTIVNGTRVTVTETQKTVRLADGGLRTTSRVHKEVTELPNKGKDSKLWKSQQALSASISEGLDRLRQSGAVHAHEFLHQKIQKHAAKHANAKKKA